MLSWYLFECECGYCTQYVETDKDCFGLKKLGYHAGECPQCGVKNNLLIGEVYLDTPTGIGAYIPITDADPLV